MTKELSEIETVVDQLLSSVDCSAQLESVPLDAALGRVLAEDVVSPFRLPRFDLSAVDGYAGRLSEFAEGAVPRSACVAAGDSASQQLAPNSCVRIFTGAPIPEGADVVVMQEHVEEVDGLVHVNTALKPAQNIREAGNELEQGQKVLRYGQVLKPQDLGLLASLGITSVNAYRKIRVAVFSTGDELQEPGQTLKDGHIYDSNRYTILGMLRALGVEMINMGIVPDDREATLAVLKRAEILSDLIITSGGVSVGERDWVKDCVEQAGKLMLWKVAIKPGKPFAFGRVGQTPFVGLPGNPSAVLVTLLILVKPLLRKLQGYGGWAHRVEQLPCDFEFPANKLREQFLFVRRCGETEQPHLEVGRNQSSGILATSSWADGIVRVPAMQSVTPGMRLPYYAFSDLFA